MLGKKNPPTLTVRFPSRVYHSKTFLAQDQYVDSMCLVKGNTCLVSVRASGATGGL